MGTRQLQPASGQTLGDRCLGVLRLDWPTYAAIKDDPAANGQAWLVVVLTGLVSGMGGAAPWRMGSRAWIRPVQRLIDPSTGQPLPVEPVVLPASAQAGLNLLTILLTIGLTVVVWLVVAALAGWAGKTFFGGDRSVTGEQVRRLVGWAYAPLMFNVFGWALMLGPVVALAVCVWAISTLVLALQTGLSLTSGKAIGAWLVAALLLAPLWVVLDLFVAFAGLAITGLASAN